MRKENRTLLDRELIKIVSTQGVWAILSFTLIFYILKAQEKRDIKQEEREKKYQYIIEQLTEKFEKIYREIQDIKQSISSNNLQEKEN